MLALTASGPSSFTGNLQLVPVFKIEGDGHGNAEVTADAVSVAAAVGVLYYLSHRLVDFEGGLLREVSAEHFIHDFLSSHLVIGSCSKLFPGSSTSESLASFNQESENFLTRLALFLVPAGLTIDVFVVFVAGDNRSVIAGGVLGADSAGVLGSGDGKVSTEVCRAFGNTSVAEGSSSVLEVMPDESSEKDHEPKGKKG